MFDKIAFKHNIKIEVTSCSPHHRRTYREVAKWLFISAPQGVASTPSTTTTTVPFASETGASSARFGSHVRRSLRPPRAPRNSGGPRMHRRRGRMHRTKVPTGEWPVQKPPAITPSREEPMTTQQHCDNCGAVTQRNKAGDCTVCLEDERTGEDREVGYKLGLEEARLGEMPSGQPIITPSPQEHRAVDF